MPTLPTNDKAIDKLPLPKAPKQVRYTRKDKKRGLAMVLVVSYKGTKSFNARYYVNGVARTFSLGKRPEMTLDQAWDKAEQLRKDPAAFIAADPRNAKKAELNATTFQAVAERYFKAKVQDRLKTADKVRRIMENYLYPAWGNKQFTDIRRQQVTHLLDKVQEKVNANKRAHFKTDGAAQSDAVLSVISSICRYYGDHLDEHYKSPCTAAMKKTDQHETMRDRVLCDKKNEGNDGELFQLWNADAHPMFMDVLRLCLLTAQRRTKVASMKWQELNGNEWTVPQDNEKKGTGGSLKLPALAMDIINRQPKIYKSPYVFAISGGKHFSAFGPRKRELDRILDIPDWRIHDLRRTARTLMERPELNIQPHIAERILGHAQENIKKVYNHHAYDKEKSIALDALASHIDAIVNPKPPANNVINLSTQLKAITTAA